MGRREDNARIFEDTTAFINEIIEQIYICALKVYTNSIQEGTS